MNDCRELNLSRIYIGKPDARDELDTEGAERFIEAFVMPPHFDLEGLLHGDKAFITGYKGTGKTALLLYLDHLYKEEDPSACSSFLLFKSDYRETKRSRMAAQARRAVSTMVMDKENLEENDDFSYLWRWHLFRQMIRDNEHCDGGLFEDDRSWQQFRDLIDSLAPMDRAKGRKAGLEKINLSLPFFGGAIKPEMGLNFQSREEEADLVEVIEEATDLFRRLRRTGTPYYIFVDELEANYGERNHFHRDLCLIRDLMLEIKAINILCARAGMKQTKIICAARREVINAINREITSRELNKVIAGFDCPLIWDYNLDAGFEHPLIRILCKRIEISEQLCGCTDSPEDLVDRWFPESRSDTLNFILNHGWFKPRDIVRLLTAAKHSPSCRERAFTDEVFADCMPEYSRESLEEQREELRAIYTAQEIDGIFTCLKGYRDVFTMEEIQEHARTNFPDTPLAQNTRTVLEDLYRLGILGNYIRSEHTDDTGARYRFQHRGNDRVILTAPWELMVHRGLHKELSILRSQTKPEEFCEPDPLAGSEGLLLEVRSGTNGGIRGRLADPAVVVTVSRKRLQAAGVLGNLQNVGLMVRLIEKNATGDSYSAEIIGLVEQTGPQLSEGMLPCGLYPGDETELTEVRTKGGRLRGIFLEKFEATVSASRLRGRNLAELCADGSVRVRILKKNPLGESYEAELAE